MAATLEDRNLGLLTLRQRLPTLTANFFAANAENEMTTIEYGDRGHSILFLKQNYSSSQRVAQEISYSIGFPGGTITDMQIRIVYPSATDIERNRKAVERSIDYYLAQPYSYTHDEHA